MIMPNRKGRPEGHCYIKAVSHSLVKGGDADGKRAPGESPAHRGMVHHRADDDDSHSPKSVLAARKPPGRLA